MVSYKKNLSVCQLNENNYFVGMTIADLDPMDNNHYLLPRFSIQAKQPEFKHGYIAQWTGDTWQYIEDHRGETVYSKKTGEVFVINELGVLPATVTTIPCPDKYHQWSDKTNNWIEKADAEQLRLQDKRNNAGSLSRTQMLSQLEISLGKDKESMIEIAGATLSQIELIKTRNYICETSQFRLDSELWWNFLIDILQIKPGDIFKIWEEAKNI